MEKLLLIDGNSLLHRAFYAMPLLKTKNGEYTNAVLGFLNLFFKAIETIQPTHVAISFDVKAPTFRHELYQDYKAGRKAMPEEMRPQLPVLKDVLKAMNVKIIEKPGLEGDDIIGTLAKRFDVQTIIVSGDRDMLQLVDDTTEVFLTKKGLSELQCVSKDNIKEIFGILAEQVVDFKALMGDASDNIPGVVGIGEVTALKLISKYSTLDNMYNNASEIAGKMGEKIIAGKDNAYLSQKLAKIVTNGDIALNLNDCEFSMPLKQSAYKKFEELEFASLLKRTSLFGEVIVDKVENIAKEVVLTEIVDIEAFGNLIANVRGCNRVALHIDEATHFVSLTAETGKEFLIKTKLNLIDDGLDEIEILKCLEPLLNDDKVTKLVFDAKALKHFLSKFDVLSSGNFEDISLLAYCAGITGAPSINEIIEKNMLSSNYIANSMLELYDIYIKEIENMGLLHLYELEKKASDVLFDMEAAGFKIDLVMLEELEKEFSKKIGVIESEIISIAGENFNINSPKQLATILFEKFALTPLRKTKSGFSTDNETLTSLIGEHDIIEPIINYRKLVKLYGTYIEGLKNVTDKNGFVHTVFKQALTTTGRLSSVEPNLQNIPVKEPEGQRIRAMFVASNDGGFLVAADYSQIELRLLAHLSNDEALIEAFKSGEDIHAKTASTIFGVPINEVTSKMRRSAKAINFGIIYGKGDFSLAKDLGITRHEAKDYIEKYFASYPRVKDYLSSSIEFARQNGYVKTLFGRIRKMEDINAKNFALRSSAERASMNMPLQGTASDIIKMAMVNVYDELKKQGLKSKLILQVHDELIVDAVNGEEKQVSEILVREMQNVAKLKVDLKVDVETTKRWFEL